MPEHALSFLCDERIQALSAQAESFLNRLREVFLRYPMALDEHGRAPADPAQLRNLTYPHRPDIRHTYVARWFVEIESASLVTVYETEHGRWFELGCDALAALPPTAPVDKPEPARLIHTYSQPSGLSPPKIDKIIAAAAAAASDSLDLIARLRPFFPRHDVASEYRRYEKNRRKADQPCVAVADNPRVFTFVKWMLKAAVPIVRKPATQSLISLARRSPAEAADLCSLTSDSQGDLFDEANHKRFMEQYRRKLS
jgi:hypothetical protein